MDDPPSPEVAIEYEFEGIHTGFTQRGAERKAQRFVDREIRKERWRREGRVLMREARR